MKHIIRKALPLVAIAAATVGTTATVAHAGKHPQATNSYVMHLGPESAYIQVSQQCPRTTNNYSYFNLPRNYSSTNWRPWVRAFKVPAGYNAYDTYSRVYYTTGVWHCFPTSGYAYPLKITRR